MIKIPLYPSINDFKIGAPHSSNIHSWDALCNI